MNDFFTKLPITLEHLQAIELDLEKKLVELRHLHEVVEQPISLLENWTVPGDLMGWNVHGTNTK
jgi:hypothetical protein